MILAEGHAPIPGSLQSNLDALETLCDLAIRVNLALFFFNLLPIPPLDGSHILRHYLPYNALSVYDSIGMFSYMLMIFVGGPLVRILMSPTLDLIYLILRRL